MGKTGRKKKSGKGQDADTTTLDNNNMKDMELPDDFSIAGTSVVSGSDYGNMNVNNVFDDNNYDNNDDDRLGNNDNIDNTQDPSNKAQTASQLRHSKLSDALSFAISSIPSEKRSTKRETTYRILFKAITHYATGDMGRMLLTNQWNDLLDSCLLPSLNVSSSGRGGGGGGSAKNSTPAEQYAACRVVEASSVVLGRWDRDDDDDGMVVVDALHGPLVKIVNATGRATQVRVASLRCLAMIHFLSSGGGGGGGGRNTNNDYHCFEEEEDDDDDDATMESVLKLCEQLSSGKKYRGEEVPWSLRAGALDCWSLLGSVLHDVRVAGGNGNRGSNGHSHNDGYHNSDGDGDGDYDNHNDESDGNDDISNNSNNNSNDDAYHSTIPQGRGLGLLPILSSCLDSTDVGLRSSAGECLALIHECRLNLGMEGDAADNATERRFSRGSWDGSEWEVIMDEIKQRIAELSVESGHHMSKKSKKEQRATFRDYMATIVDDESPQEVVNFRGGTVELNSWREVIQLNFVRHCLQGGFQIQMMMNVTLHAVFGVDGRVISDGSGAVLSQLEKRLTLSKTSDAARKADKVMMKQRRTRTNVKNHFITADGDDI